MMSATQSASASASDLEAQRPSTPAPAWSPPPMRMLDPTDATFGYTLSASTSGTHESRHDERPTSTLVAGDIPPPYAEEAAIPLPEYSLHAPEPVTLAMFLFKFGFLFPPFWLFGIFILFSPLREPSCTSSENTSTPSWMPEKTESERQQIIATIRSAELKWAKRCLVALVIFSLLSAVAGVGAWVIRRQLA